MLDHFVWTGIFLGVPAVVLGIALVRLIGYVRRQWHPSRGQALAGAGAIAIIMALLTRVANEKSLLVIALLCWAYLMAWILRQALGLRPAVRRSAATAQDPNSLNFSGVDRGFQGFGIYMHGVRVGNDPIDDDTH
jgi:chromate transport protein ChrA